MFVHSAFLLPPRPVCFFLVVVKRVDWVFHAAGEQSLSNHHYVDDDADDTVVADDDYGGGTVVTDDDDIGGDGTVVVADDDASGGTVVTDDDGDDGSGTGGPVPIDNDDAVDDDGACCKEEATCGGRVDFCGRPAASFRLSCNAVTRRSKMTSCCQQSYTNRLTYLYHLRPKGKLERAFHLTPREDTQWSSTASLSPSHAPLPEHLSQICKASPFQCAWIFYLAECG